MLCKWKFKIQWFQWIDIMATPLTAKSGTPVLDREFLEIRALILQLAAALDRVDRNDCLAAGDLRVERIRQGLQIVSEWNQAANSQATSDRAARVQLAFSRPYDAQWRTQYEI
jgi:hypothetical protein